MQVPVRGLSTYTFAYRSPDMLVDSSPGNVNIEDVHSQQPETASTYGSHTAEKQGCGISFPVARDGHGVRQPYIKRLRIR